MTRVSLKEAYDNKDVIAQILAIRDTAESAVDTSEQAVTTANTASEHVDALVPQVEGAVQNANSASASAQASAQTVAGYEGRLTVAEGAIDELESNVGTVEDNLNAVTLRVTTAEGQIVTIQGRVTALETADGQNVKLTGPNAIGNYAVLLTGNQSKSGNMTFLNLVRLEGDDQYLNQFFLINKRIEKSNRTQRQESSIFFQGKDNENLASIIYAKYPNGEKHLIARLYDDNGNYHDTDIATWTGDL